MKAQAKAGAAFARLDDSDAGEGLAIFFSQSGPDTVRWRLDVYAKLDTGAECLVGTLYVSPPGVTTPAGPLSRQVGAAVCPGAKTWSVCAYPASGSQAALGESAQIELTSSKCCTAPVGVTRVGERYAYRSGSPPGPTVFSAAAGRVITRLTAVAIAPGGSVQVGSGEDIIAIPTGTTLILEPKAPIPAFAQITLTNVNWTIEFLESA